MQRILCWRVRAVVVGHALAGLGLWVMAGLFAGPSSTVFAQAQNLPATPNQSLSVLPAIQVTERPEAPLALRGVSLPAGAAEVPWLEQPLSSTVISREQLIQTGGGRLTDMLRFDASVDANYSPLGYYEGFQVRGFAVDPVFGFRINGVPVVGESPLFLGNKQQVEVLRGPGGASYSPGAAGGLIHLVTKRPASIRRLDASMQTRSSAGLAADIGALDDEGNGWRLNMGADRLRPYAKGADGESGAIAFALDRYLSQGRRLALDIEIQRSAQITQPGSQLLGGTQLPPVRPKTVLGLSSWSEPVTFDSIFGMAQLDMPLQNGWLASTRLSAHRVKTDDYSSFPWGSGFADPIGAFGGTARDAYFADNGDFILWDYRSLNEIRRTQSLGLDLRKQISLSGVTHEIMLGAEFIDYLSTKPNYLYATPTDPETFAFLATGNVLTNSWVGSATGLTGSDVFLRRVRQTTFHASDRFALGAGSLTMAARWSALKDTFRSDFSPGYYTTIDLNTRTDHWLLPSLTYARPVGETQQLWAAYRSDIEAGAVAPLSAANNGSVLPARRIHVVELGTKAILSSGFQASAVLFRSWRPYNFRDDQGLDAATGLYIQQGRESRTGLELATAGRFTPHLQAQASMTYTASDTAGTGRAWVEGRDVLNMPRLRMAALLDYGIPHFQGLSAWAGWFYVGRRAATRDNAVWVPSYQRVDMGLTYEAKAFKQIQTYRFSVENIFDKPYWRDAAEFLGDAYLTPGSPRIFKLSVTTTF